MARKANTSNWSKQYPVQLNEKEKDNLDKLQAKIEASVGLPVKKKDIVAHLIEASLQQMESSETWLRTADLNSLYTKLATNIEPHDFLPDDRFSKSALALRLMEPDRLFSEARL